MSLVNGATTLHVLAVNDSDYAYTYVFNINKGRKEGKKIKKEEARR